MGSPQGVANKLQLRILVLSDSEGANDLPDVSFQQADGTFGRKVEESVSQRKLSPHSLPPLLIPRSSNSPDTPTSSTLATPRSSLSSPITGVVDLTNEIKSLNESPITRGAFSDIYRAQWRRESCSGDGGKRETVLVNFKVVAVKLLRVFAAKDVDSERLHKRLNREVYVWHRLEHPNIAKFFGTSYHMGGRPSMVMEWYSNGSADEYLRDHLDADRLNLVRDVAEGLTYLHTLCPPIVHGDLKSNNVLITDQGSAVLSDFGLSQVIGDLLDHPSGLTPSNPMFGPPRWQAPELIEDEACQPGLATDVWGFGCTAYEILTGNLPYNHRRRDACVIRDIEHGIKPAGPGPFRIAGSDGSIEDILENRCWSFDPAARPQMTVITPWIRRLCHDKNFELTRHVPNTFSTPFTA